MDEIQKELDNRGGSKIETVHDIIKQRKKKMRQRMVMNQKANSIADLAAVLIEQDTKGATTAEEKNILAQSERSNEVAEMLRLAHQGREGGIEKLDTEIAALQSRKQAKKEGQTDDAATSRGLARQINALEKQRRRMRFCVEAVTAAEQGTALLTPEQRRAREADQAARESLPSLRAQIAEQRAAESGTPEESAISGEEPNPESAPEKALEAARIDVEEPTDASEEAESSVVEAEQADEPTEQELIEAAKQVRRLSKRVLDVETISAFENAAGRLSRGEELLEELVPSWGPFDPAKKQQRYVAYVTDLQRQKGPLQKAREIVARDNGPARLLQAAGAARERSIAARKSGHDNVSDQERLTAKMYEIVAQLREYEDVILRAPESALVEAVDEQTQAEEQQYLDAEASSAAEPGQGVTAQATRSEAAQQEAAAPETDTPPALTPDPVDYQALLPSFPERTTLPKKGKIRNKLIELRRPIFTAAGVTVRWNNMLDAEYAEKWPEDVRHEPMGLSRHTAPKPTQAPMFDVAEFKNQPGGGYKGRKFERGLERSGVREAVKGVTESVIEAVLARERKAEERERAAAMEKREALELRMATRAERRAERAREAEEASQAEGEREAERSVE